MEIAQQRFRWQMREIRYPVYTVRRTYKLNSIACTTSLHVGYCIRQSGWCTVHKQILRTFRICSEVAHTHTQNVLALLLCCSGRTLSNKHASSSKFLEISMCNERKISTLHVYILKHTTVWYCWCMNEVVASRLKTMAQLIFRVEQIYEHFCHHYGFPSYINYFVLLQKHCGERCAFLVWYLPLCLCVCVLRTPVYKAHGASGRHIVFVPTIAYIHTMRRVWQWENAFVTCQQMALLGARVLNELLNVILRSSWLLMASHPFARLACHTHSSTHIYTPSPHHSISAWRCRTIKEIRCFIHAHSRFLAFCAHTQLFGHSNRNNHCHPHANRIILYIFFSFHIRTHHIAPWHGHGHAFIHTAQW